MHAKGRREDDVASPGGGRHPFGLTESPGKMRLIGKTAGDRDFLQGYRGISQQI
jgi:hypothetical protein